MPSWVSYKALIAALLVVAVIVAAVILVARSAIKRRLPAMTSPLDNRDVEREAYQIYVDRGSTPGQEKADWAEAIARLTRVKDRRSARPGALSFAAATLAVMFPLLGFSFISVTATQIQARFAALGSITRPLSVGHVADLAERLDAFGLAERASWPPVNAKFEDASKARVKAEKARADANRLLDAVTSAAGGLRDRLQAFKVNLPARSADDLAAARDLTRVADAEARCSSDDQCLASARKLKADLGNYEAGEKTALEAERGAASLKSDAEAAFEAAENTSYTRRYLINKVLAAFEAPVQAKVEGALIEYSRAVSDAWFISRYSYLVARSPVETLTLWLVLALGALGAILQIAYTFITGGYLLWSYLFFRPLFGAVTALTVYIFFKAGVLVLAVSADQTGSTAINPYTTGFIAILSGLLSEQAILTLKNTGLRFFSGQTDAHRARWSRADLSAQIDDGLAAKLASMLGLSVVDLQQKLKGFTRSTWDEQRLIAVSLGKEVRDAFSDLPSAEATDAGQAS